MTIDEAVEAAAGAPTWDARIAAIRLVPERFGTASHQEVYSLIAKRVYVPNLAPDFAYVHWRDEYELEPLQSAYDQASALTDQFRRVEVQDLERTLQAAPATLRIFRLILGFTSSEFSAATLSVAEEMGKVKPVSGSTLRGIESGTKPKELAVRICARAIHLAMRGELFAESSAEGVRLKTHKPDTENGWGTVRDFADHGVPLPIFLHQPLYGGAFRQLLDATSSDRGDILEDAVETLFREAQVPFIRTGAHNQEEIATRFGITVKPAPDFVFFDGTGALRAILECKGANDGGTARDKAARFRALRAEAARLGGIPLFAVLADWGGDVRQTRWVPSSETRTDASLPSPRCKRCSRSNRFRVSLERSSSLSLA